ncbi:hypothetical protein D3C86_1937120 [compost metagenome]
MISFFIWSILSWLKRLPKPCSEATITFKRSLAVCALEGLSSLLNNLLQNPAIFYAPNNRANQPLGFTVI